VAYFDLTAAASSARFCCNASYSGVPLRGGTSFGIPPSHIGTLSATTPLIAGRGSDAHADSAMEAIVANAGLVTFNIMIVTNRPNHAYSMAETASVGGFFQSARLARVLAPIDRHMTARKSNAHQRPS
jgi:hypothetical protein